MDLFIVHNQIFNIIKLTHYLVIHCTNIRFGFCSIAVIGDEIAVARKTIVFSTSLFFFQYQLV